MIVGKNNFVINSKLPYSQLLYFSTEELEAY